MQSENRFFDDVVKVLNGAAGTVAGMTREAESNFRERMREWMGSQDMVSREEFEAVKAIAVAAREESLALKARLDALEGQPPAGATTPAAGATTPAAGATTPAADAPKAAAPRARKPRSEGPSPG